MKFNLHNLQYLDFDDNNLSGLITSMIFNNSIIEAIDFSGNKLFGSSAINHWSLPSKSARTPLRSCLKRTLNTDKSESNNPWKVTVLELPNNLFSGLIPDTIGNCRQLQILHLGYNYLTTGSSTPQQSFYSSLTSCRYLRFLAIESTPSKGVLSNLNGNFSASLEYLFAGSGQLSGGIPL